ncbi:MAG: alpha/beta hydrolase [Acidobacteria bacterium]|nr:alpha/beta hydrolase [Acidobacteriota bacterium]
MASPDIQTVRELLASRPQSEELSIEETRLSFDQLGQSFPMPDGVSVSSAAVSGINAEWVRAANARDDVVILYLHGGGYIVGSLVSHRHLSAALSQASGASVLALDYRLAPENPFPAAVEDAIAAYQWLLQQHKKPSQIALAGDSAGGGLTLATLVALRDQGIALPACGVCLSPWVDLTNSSESYQTVADPMLRKEGLDEMAKAYLQGEDLRTPLASPLYADLQGLPPLLVQIGTADLLYAEALDLKARATAAGVQVELEVWDEMIHVWHLFYPMLQEGREAITKIGAYVKAQTA